MIHSLIQQFRDRYPMGSLTADLLMLHDGQYIVRAVVQLERSTVATGMAASSELTAAEDSAKNRALQSLGLTAQSAPTAMPTEITSAAEAVSGPESTLPLPPAAAATVKTTPFPERPQVATPSPPMNPPPAQKIDAASPSPTPAPTEPISQPAPVSPAPPQPDVSEEAELPFPNTGPIDLSDILAQTDVELRRLGWSVQQGREFLEKTYSKRSRHDLSDEELMDFLLYLEGQPSPIEY